MDALLQLIPAEFRIGRPAELRLELHVGARGQRAHIQSAEPDTRGRNYQLQLIAATGDRRAFQRRGAWAVLMGTGILVVN